MVILGLFVWWIEYELVWVRELLGGG